MRVYLGTKFLHAKFFMWILDYTCWYQDSHQYGSYKVSYFHEVIKIWKCKGVSLY